MDAIGSARNGNTAFPGAAPPSMFVGAGLGWDFGRTQLEVLYDILDIQSKDERTHQLMLGLGFRFGK